MAFGKQNRSRCDICNKACAPWTDREGKSCIYPVYCDKCARMEGKGYITKDKFFKLFNEDASFLNGYEYYAILVMVRTLIHQTYKT